MRYHKHPHSFDWARWYLPRDFCELTKQFWDIRLANAVQGPPGLEPQSQSNDRAETHGKSIRCQPT